MKINDNCIGCGSCVMYCPMSAIKKMSKKKKYFIDLEDCVECSLCEEFSRCPQDAIENTKLDRIRRIRKEVS